jgi:hypothetical protein
MKIPDAYRLRSSLTSLGVMNTGRDARLTFVTLRGRASGTLRGV